jgi:hypothetical protein
LIAGLAEDDVVKRLRASGEHRGAANPTLDDLTGRLPKAKLLHARDPEGFEKGRWNPRQLGSGINEQ